MSEVNKGKRMTENVIGVGVHMNMEKLRGKRLTQMGEIDPGTSS